MNRLAKALMVLCALALPMTAFAIVPDPSLSQTPDCVRLFPDPDAVGQFGGGTLVAGVVGQVFGTDGLPLGDEEVRLIFSGACVNLRLCPDDTTPPVFVVTTTSDAMGNFEFAPPGGGCCAEPGSAEIHADPGDVTLLPIYSAVGSPDSGGDGTPVADLIIDGIDLSRFAMELSQNDVPTEPCYDYSRQPAAPQFCDGQAEGDDLTLFAFLFQTGNNMCP